MVDVNKVLFEFLTASGSTLYTLMGTRCYAGSFPTGYTNTQAAIRFERIGGAPDQFVADKEVMFRIRCYGGTGSHKECNALYRALEDKLHGADDARTTTGAILGPMIVSEGQELTDPDTKWPFTTCVARAIFHD